MTISLIFSTAIRYLAGSGPNRKDSRRRIRGGVLGIALSLVPLVLVYEMASGMIEGITLRFLETWSWHAQIHDGNNQSIESLQSLAQDLESSGLAELASPELRGTGLARGEDGSRPILVRGLEPNIFSRDAGLRDYLRVQEGEFNISEPSDIILGTALARALGLRVGDKMRVLSYAGGSWTGLPRISHFTVRALVSCGYQDLDRSWAFVNIERADNILSSDNRTMFIGLKFAEPYQLPNPLSQKSGGIQTPSRQWVDWEEYGQGLFSVIKQRMNNTGNSDSWSLFTWYQAQRLQLEHFVGTRTLLLIIMILIVLVASVNVSSTMILMVLEKQYDLAMLKSLGARPSDIALLFLLMGAGTGFAGAVIGMIVGAVLSLGINQVIAFIELIVNIVSRVMHFFRSIINGSLEEFHQIELLNPEFYLEQIPVSLHVWDLVFVFILTIVLSLLASIIPAHRAALLSPSEIMRRV